MPDPADYSSEDEWMEACVSAVRDEGKPQDQAVAQCLNMWRERNKALPAVDRAYSVLTVKSVNEEQRIIRGIATTPETDRVGDIVESLGINFKNPLPLLLHHRHDQPVGKATFDKPTDKGITFQAMIAKIAEPGKLKDRVDEAWQSIKHGLIAGVSIGFKPRDWEMLDNGGVRFVKSDVFELSLVTIPANAAATISVIKQLDDESTAASGHPRQPQAAARPGASGKPPINLKLTERTAMSKTITEQLAALEAKRAANEARMNDIMTKAMDEGRSTDEQEREEFDNLQAEVDQLDGDLKRFKSLERTNQAKAQPVSQVASTAEGAAARSSTSIQVKSPELPPGIAFARVVKSLGMAQGNRFEAGRIAEHLWPDRKDIAKAAVMGGTTIDSAWAGALVGDETNVFADFVEFLRPQTVIGKFGQGGVPALTQVPFRTALIGQTSGGSGYWVGEGQPKPLTSFAFERRTLEPLKVANIAVVTEELLQSSAPSAEGVIRNSLARALVERLDTDFLDPAKTAVAGISPASITNGVTAVASSGTTPAAVQADVQAIMAGFIAANALPTGGVWIMATQTALALSLMLTSLGQPAYPGVTMTGGTLLGMPVIVSDYVPTGGGSPNTKMVILVSAPEIYVGDEGGISIDMSREASVQMMDNPTNAVVGPGGSPLGTPVATTLVSLWQTDSVGFRAERTINWLKRRASAVQMLSGVVWGM